MRTPSLIALVALGWTTGALALSPADFERRTVDVAERYLAIWSSGDPEAVTGVPYIYGRTVRFYGRTYTQAQLVDEKRRAVRRWPVRRYVHRPGTMRVTCNVPEAKCAARSLVDYEVSDPARGLRKRGTARFDLGVGFDGPRPRILYEGGGPAGRPPG